MEDQGFEDLINFEMTKKRSTKGKTFLYRLIKLEREIDDKSKECLKRASFIPCTSDLWKGFYYEFVQIDDSSVHK